MDDHERNELEGYNSYPSYALEIESEEELRNLLLQMSDEIFVL